MMRLGVIVALLAAAGLIFMPEPDLETLVTQKRPELDTLISSGDPRIDPGELLNLIYNNGVALRILDVRPESDYNLFHIVDAERVERREILDPGWRESLPSKTVMVLVSNDEAGAWDAWKLLHTAGISNIYVLAGGVNFWLDLYGGPAPAAAESAAVDPPAPGDDLFRHRFDAALGARQPGAEPDPHAFPERKYVRKVKTIGTAVRTSGGCS